jgi:diacylglycerol O-acyltransferase / wax synthase
MPLQDPGEFRFADRMTDVETMMWRLEGLDPMFRTAMTMVVALDGAPSRAEVVDRLDLVSRRIPRLRDRVAIGPLEMVPPRWERDPGFDVRHQLRHAVAPGSGSPQDLLLAAEAAASVPFDPQHPPWQVTFVEGLRGGCEGLVLKLHHSYTDGLGGVKLALELFDLEPRPSQASPRGSAPDQPPRPSLIGRLAEDLVFEAQQTADVLGRVLPWAVTTLRDALHDPDEVARSTLDLARAVRSQADQAARPGSPIMTKRSSEIRLAAIDLPLSRLRRAARHAGGTINDAFLAGLLGGLGLYHDKHGVAASTLRVGMPVSTRSDDTSANMHNQVEAVLLRGPLKVTDPVERIRLLHEMVGHARSQPFLGLLDEVTGLGVRLPGIRHVLARLARSIDVVASNVPGPPMDLYLAGCRLERIVPVGPRGGSGLNVTLLSYRGTVHVGVNMDPAATPDTGVLLDCLASGFEEVLESAP